MVASARPAIDYVSNEVTFDQPRPSLHRSERLEDRCAVPTRMSSSPSEVGSLTAHDTKCHKIMHDSTPPARSFPHGETAFVRQALLRYTATAALELRSCRAAAAAPPL